jgi:hypothetical protein
MHILAYVDPGTGALIWQSIVAAFVGSIFYLKKTRKWLGSLWLKISGRGTKLGGSVDSAAFRQDALKEDRG